jgi:hypothetical protein
LLINLCCLFVDYAWLHRKRNISDFQMVYTHFLNIDKKLFNYKTSEVISGGRFPFLSFFFFFFFLSFLFFYFILFYFFLTPSNLYFQHLTFLKHYFVAIYTSKLSTRFTGLNHVLENIHIKMDKILDDIIKEKMQTITITKDDDIVWCASSTSRDRQA